MAKKQEVLGQEPLDYGIQNPEAFAQFQDQFALETSLVGRDPYALTRPSGMTKKEYDEFRKYAPGLTFEEAMHTGGLEEARAQQQTRGEQWARGIPKFVGKTSTAVAGGTVGALYGLGAMIAQRDFNAIYDNGFQRAMDSADEWMDEKLGIYATEEEKNENFYRSLNNSSFWANDVLGGLSFTAGAIVSEMVWSAATGLTAGLLAPVKGANTLRLLGQASKFMKNFSKVDRALTGIGQAATIGKLGQAGRVMRQMYTGAGYEAGVEARHHKKELMDHLKNEWYKENPDADEIPVDALAEMDDYANRSANGVFGANMFIVGLSHMVALPRIFGPGAKSQMNAFKNIKTSVEDIGGAWKVAFKPAYQNASKLGQIAEAAYVTVKNPLVEGVWEEGMQGVANNTALDYTTKKYNEDATGDAANLVESFGHGLKETYGGKQGWKEIGIGMIIGGIGSPNINAYRRNSKTGKREKLPGQPGWTGGIIGEIQDLRMQRREADSRAKNAEDLTKDILFNFSEDYMQKNPDAVKASREAMKDMIRSAVLNEEYDAAVANGSLFDVKNVENDLIHSFIMSRINAGVGYSLTDEFTRMVDDMSEQEFKDALGYDDITEENLQQRKQEVINKFKERVERTQTIVDRVDSAYRGNLQVRENEDVREAMIYAGATIEDAAQREATLAGLIARDTDVLYDNEQRGEQYKEKYRQEVEDAIKDLPKVEKDEIRQNLKDLENIQKRRERFLSQYNTLFTKQGQEDYVNLTKKIHEAQKEAALSAIAKFYEGDKVVIKRDTSQRFKKWDDEDGKSYMMQLDENGKPIEDTKQEINYKSEEFISEYSIEAPEAGADEVVVDQPTTDTIIKKINEFKDPDELADYINNQIAPLGLPDHDLIRREAAKKYKELTGKKLDTTKEKPAEYVTKTYINKENEKRYAVTKDKVDPDTYFVRELKDGKPIGNQITVNKAQLDELYVFEGVWEDYQMKLANIEALEQLLESKKALLPQEKKEGKSHRKRMKELQKQYAEFLKEAERISKDKRYAERTVKAAHDLVDQTWLEIQYLQEQIDQSVQGQIALRQEILHLEHRLQEETESNARTDLQARIDALQSEMDENNELISGWRKLLKQLRTLLNKFVSMFEVGKVYEQDGAKIAEDYAATALDEAIEEAASLQPSKVVEVHHPLAERSKFMRITDTKWGEKQKKINERLRRRIAAKKAAITRTINRGKEAPAKIWATKGKIARAENQIDLLEQANNELYRDLELILMEIEAIEELTDQRLKTEKGVVTHPVVKEDVKKEKNPIETVYQLREEPPSVENETEGQSKSIWENPKRMLKYLFSGLTGRHGTADSKKGTWIFNSNPHQRRYYRWTSKTNIKEGGYRIKIVPAFESQRTAIERAKLDFDEAYNAVVIDRQGKYVTLTGTTDEFDEGTNIWTSFPLATISTQEYEKAHRPKDNDTAGWQKLYPGKTVEEAKAAYEAKRDALVAQHTALREKIKTQVKDNKQEVIFNLVDKAAGVPYKGPKVQDDRQTSSISFETAFGHTDVSMAVQTKGTVSVGGEVIAPEKIGIAFVKNEKTGNIYEVHSRKMTEDEINTVINIFRTFVNNSTYDPATGKIHSDGASILKNAKGDVVMDDVFRFLSQYLYWTGDNIRDEETGEEANTGKNRFHWERKLEGRSVSGGALQLGEKGYRLMMVQPDNSIVINQEIVNEKGEGALRDFLAEKYINLSSKAMLDTNKYEALESLDENGVATTETYENYQDFLIKKGIVGVDIIPVGTVEEFYDTEGVAIKEEVPQMLSQYAIYEVSDDFIPKPQTITPQPAPSATYDNWKNIKPGDQIRVQVIKDGQIIRDAVLEYQEDTSFTLVPGKGEVHADTVARMATIRNDENPTEAYRGLKRAMAEDGVLVAVGDVVPQAPVKEEVVKKAEPIEEKEPPRTKEEVEKRRKEELVPRFGNSINTLYEKYGELYNIPLELKELGNRDLGDVIQGIIDYINEQINAKYDAYLSALDKGVQQELPMPGLPEVINVYAGTNENAELSNFAVRPFTTGQDTWETGEFTSHYRTVEGAFQAYKLIFTDRNKDASFENLNEEDRALVEKLKKATGPEAKKLGRTIKGLNVDEWDRLSESIMEDLIYESFEQNPDALKKLLATGTTTISHTQDKTKWREAFPRALMAAREELRKEYPPVQEAPAKRRRGSGKTGANTELYRTPTHDERGVEQLSEAEKWYNERFGHIGIPFETVQNLIDGKAHGQFTEAAVYIYENAEIGTTFHEAWHVVTQVFLTRRERRAMYREYRARFPQYKDASDQVVEERLAEVFRDYMLLRTNTSSVNNRSEEKTDEQREAENKRFNKLLAEYASENTSEERRVALDEELAAMYYGEGEMIPREEKKAKNRMKQFEKEMPPIQRTLFQRLYDWITNFIYGRPESVVEMFENIKANKFRDQTPKLAFRFKRALGGKIKMNRTYQGQSEHFGRAAVESVNFFFFQRLFDAEAGHDISSLFSKGNNSEMVNDLYAYAHDQIDRHIGDIELKLNSGTLTQEEFDRLDNIADQLDFVLRNWDVAEDQTLSREDKRKYSTRGLHRNFLTQYKLEFQADETSISETTRVRDADNQVANESIKISSKVNASRNIKLLLGTLAEVYDTFEYKKNIFDLPQSTDFGQTFSILANKLAGLRTGTQIQAGIEALLSKAPQLNSLLQRLKFDVPSTTLNKSQMLEQIQFVQTFAKTHNTYVFDITGQNGKFKMVNSNRTTVNEKIKQEWASQAADNARTIYTMVEGVPFYNKEAFKEFGDVIRDEEEAIKFLRKIGVTFTVEKEIIHKGEMHSRADAILGQINSKKGLVSIFNKEVATNNKENLDVLIALERESTLDYIDNSHMNIDNNLVYDVVLNSYLSVIIDDVRNFKTRSEFLAENPHLDPENNPYVRSSMLLEPGGPLYRKDGTFKEDSIFLEIHEGSKEEESDMPSEFEDLGEPDQLRVHINRGMQGAYPLLRPADNSIERYFNLGKPLFTKGEISRNVHIHRMLDYLRDEMNRGAKILKDAQDGSKDRFQHEKENAMDGIMISILSRNSVIKEAIETFFTTDQTIDNFFKDEILVELMKEVLETYFSDRTRTMVNTMVKNGIIERKEDGDYINNGLDAYGNKSEIPADIVNSEIKNYLINDTIFNIEQTKLIFGDPIGYKSVDDQFKRHSGIVGTKKISAVYDQVNEWIDQNLRRSDRKGGYYKNGKPAVKTVIFDDIIVFSDYYKKYAERIKHKADLYAKMEEGDGQGYITIDEWREMLYRSGDWTTGEGSLEDLYQYERQIEEGIERPAYPENDPVEAGRVIDPNKLPVANPLKPQYMGPLAEEGFHMGMYKLSLLPILPSLTMARKGYDGMPQLEALRKEMKATGTGIAAFKTANKVGTKLNKDGEVQKFYDEDTGEFAFSEKGRDFVTQDTYYKYWGIQQDMGAKVKRKVVSGTQMAKQIINGIFENGLPKNEELGKLAIRYLELNKQRIEIGLGQLINSLGLKEAKDGNYVVDSIESLIERFRKEAIERDMPDNIVDAIDNLRIGAGVDTLINREKIENILLAIADSMSTSQKRSGSARVQASIAIGKVAREVYDPTTKQVWKSSDLAFYEEGKSMEVYLPSFLKGLDETTDLSSKELIDLLELIGFRIPTQGLNSIESIKVKGFLPAAAGDVIIVPSEIVAKTGSDFDVDKLNLYYPNVYYNRDGTPKYIKSENIEGQYKDYVDAYTARFIRELLGDVARDTLPKELRRTITSQLKKVLSQENTGINDVIEAIESEFDFIMEVLQTGNVQQKALYTPVAKSLNEMYNNLKTLQGQIQTGTNPEFEPMTMEEFTKRGIENEISQIQKQIILHEDNFDQLINPVSAADLEHQAEEILILKGEGRRDKDGKFERFDKATRANIVEREHLMDVARRFIGGKQAVGITAIHSTFDILAKMSGISVASEITVFRNKKPKPISTHINIPHNQTEEGNVNLSKLTDANEQSNIPEMLSAWINAAVDAATNPFMFDLNSGPDTLNVVLYLTMAGVPVDYLTRFMSQPVIVEYVANRQKWESQMMEGNYEIKERFNPFVGIIRTVESKKKYRDQIIAETQQKYIEALGLNEKQFNDLIESDTQFTLNQLNKNIGIGSPDVVTNKSFAEDQLRVLHDFLRYMDTSRKLSDAMASITYDTRAGGKNTSELSYRVESTERVRAEKNFIGFDKLLDNGFITPYYDAVAKFKKILNPFFITLNDKYVVEQFEKLYNILFNQKNNLPTDKKISVVDKFKQSFITYLLTNRGYEIDGKGMIKDGSYIRMSAEINDLFRGEDSVARQLKERKQRYKDEGRHMILLDHLEYVLNDSLDEGDTDHIITRAKRLDNIDSNRLTSEWRELFDADQDFAMRLVKATALQYGILNSPFTFTNLIPFEVYGEIMSHIIKNEATIEPDLKQKMYDDFFERFFLNNFDDNNIIPKKRKGSVLHEAYPYFKEYVLKEEYSGPEYKGTKGKEKLSALREKGVNIFAPKPIVTKADGTTMLLPDILKDYRNQKLLINYNNNSPIVSPVNTNAGEQAGETYNQLSTPTQEAPDAEINEKIKTWLSTMGINYENVENITDREGNPVTAIAKADMLHAVVQVVEGKADITTLSEEAAHFLVELLGDNNPILRGMMNAIENTPLLDEVRAEYGELYGQDETKLKKEAVGKMIAKAMIRKEKVARMNQFQRFWDAAMRWFKRHLSRVKSTDIEQEIAPFSEAADMILGNVTEGLSPLDSLKPDIFYEVTEDEAAQRDEIETGFKSNQALRDQERGGYITQAGKRVANRVSNYVKEFYDKLFRGRVAEEEAKEYNVHLALKGTILHKYLELIGDAVFAGKEAPKRSEAEKKVMEDLRNEDDVANKDFLNKEDSYFELTGKQYGELVTGLTRIRNNVYAKQKKIDPKGEVKFFPELIIYDQYGDIGGTIDLAVLYSNGAVGIYDYKGINFGTAKTLALFKEDAYSIQIGEYKRILSERYGVKNFSETRIIPIDMQMRKNFDGFYDVEMGAIGLNKEERPWLEEIPVAKETTEDKKLNLTLERMFVQYDKLRQQLQNDHLNDELAVKVARMRKAISDIQLRDDVSFIRSEIRALYEDFQKREHLPPDHEFGLNDKFLKELEAYLYTYEYFSTNALDSAERSGDKKLIEDVKKIAFGIQDMAQKINLKFTENANRGEDFNVAGNAPATTAMGRLFNRLSQFKRPVFKKLSIMVHEVFNKVRQDLNADIEVIDEKHNNLLAWAKARGWTLQQAFDYILDPETGHLVSKWKKDYFSERDIAITDRDGTWFINNAQVERRDGKYYYTGEQLEKYEAARKKQMDFIERSLPGDENRELRNRERESWDRKFNITESKKTALFNKWNRYIQPQDTPENHSDKFKEMHLKGNEPLLEYYEMYTEFNDKFGKQTGQPVGYNFVAEIHQGFIEHMKNIGNNGIGGLWGQMTRMLELHDMDLERGAIDPVSGKPQASIPLFFSKKLTGRLTPFERKRIKNEVLEIHPDENSLEFKNEYQERIRKAEYKSGTKSKSRDLSRSLILFAEAAHMNHHLTATEASAQALLSIMGSQGQETEMIDAAGKKVISSITRRAATMLGVPADEIAAMEKFINVYWYGQRTQGKDFSFTIGGVKYSGTKMFQSMLRFTSAGALSMKVLLGAGNAMGLKANAYISGREGVHYLGSDLNEAHRLFLQRDERYMGAINYIEPYTADLTYRKANKRSVSAASKVFTFENLFVVYRAGDEHIDRNITIAMMQRYGLDNDGKIRRIERIKKDDSIKDKRTLWERGKIVDDRYIIEGNNGEQISEKQFVNFRTMVQHAAVEVKGNMSQEDINLVGTTLMGQALMQFRSWMPGLISKRFKDFQYDDVFDTHDVGRFRVFFGEFTAKTLSPKLGAFIRLLGEVTAIYGYKHSGVNNEVTERFYKKYRAANPDMNLTLEEFADLRLRKLQGMARELQILLGFFIAVTAGKAMIPDEDEEALGKASRLLAQNSYRAAQRGYLELSFFFSFNSAMTILKSPIPSMRLFVNLQKALFNTWDESWDVILGEDTRLDRTPRGYYFSKVIPVLSAYVDFVDLWETYNISRGY